MTEHAELIAVEGDPRALTFHTNGRKPVRITADGRVFIDGEEFMMPIEYGSIRLERCTRRHNRLTMTLFVGPVSMEVAHDQG